MSTGWCPTRNVSWHLNIWLTKVRYLCLSSIEAAYMGLGSQKLRMSFVECLCIYKSGVLKACPAPQGVLKPVKYQELGVGAAQRTSSLVDLNGYIRGVCSVWRELAQCRYRRTIMLKKAGCVCLLQGSLKESLYSLNEIFI